jgi:peptidoglycan/LPS O-acetylase OafA/YrhL
MNTATQTDARRWPATALHELRHRPTNQMPALDGLRAFAVLMVICDHWAYEWTIVAHQAAPALTRLPMFYWGWTGVDLFFVLSGFLIGKQLWGELFRTDTISVTQFVLRRGLRIWPLYYTCMLFLVIVRSVRAPSWPDWVMLSNYVDGNYGRSWSLSTEEQFYLLMPTLLLLFRRFLKPRWWPIGIGVLLCAVSVGRAITAHQYTVQGLPSKQISTLMYPAFHLHCEPLLIGLLIAWVTLRKPAWLAPAAQGQVARRAVATATVMLVVGITLRVANRQVFPYMALGCIYGAALCVALADRSVPSALLRWRGWYIVARLSFGMYLNHLILREPTDTILRLVIGGFGENSVPGFLVGLVLTILGSMTMAAITFVLIEQPGLALRDRWLARRRSAASVSIAIPAH